MTFQTGPILIRSQFGLQTTKTAGFSDSTRNRLPKRRADTKFRRKGSRRICRCPRPKLGTRPAPGQGPEPITPNPGLDMRLDTGHAMTTAARLDGTNIQPVLRHPVVAGLSCIPIRIPLPSTSTTELHPRPACCLATRSDKPTPALTPRIPDRRVMAISRSIIGLRLCGLLIEPVRHLLLWLPGRLKPTNNPLCPGFDYTLEWLTGKPNSTCFVPKESDVCHPAEVMGSGRIHSNRPTCLGSDRYVRGQSVP